MGSSFQLWLWARSAKLTFIVPTSVSTAGRSVCAQPCFVLQIGRFSTVSDVCVFE